MGDLYAWVSMILPGGCGGPTDISLPKIGAKLKQSEPGWSIKREDLAAEVLSPMSGIVMATNQNALRQPDLSKKTRTARAGWSSLTRSAA